MNKRTRLGVTVDARANQQSSSHEKRQRSSHEKRQASRAHALSTHAASLGVLSVLDCGQIRVLALQL